MTPCKRFKFFIFGNFKMGFKKFFLYFSQQFFHKIKMYPNKNQYFMSQILTSQRDTHTPISVNLM